MYTFVYIRVKKFTLFSILGYLYKNKSYEQERYKNQIEGRVGRTI